MAPFEQTLLWKKSLSERENDSASEHREALRSAFRNMRERAKHLAEMVAADIPQLTVHDISHIDALWEYADMIAGEDFPLNACEGFVLGAAFLIHDLGLSARAYPGGMAEIRQTTEWKDVIASLQESEFENEPADDAGQDPGTRIEQEALLAVLRKTHAERARRLALESWRDPNSGNQSIYLIDIPELRETFGDIIGRIAHSHWRDVSELHSAFATNLGAPPTYPAGWTVDGLKISCLFRAADYCHLDGRRAPLFLRVLRLPTGASLKHWQFQGKLLKPHTQGDQLVYTSTRPFPVQEAAAWWECYDTLHALDQELRRIDSCLADASCHRFCVRTVSHTDNPSRLSQLIPTEGWKPVDTRIRATAVARLVSSLGGRQLYGRSGHPPLRELIQNAADAIRARRILDGKEKDWGEIHVSTGSDGSAIWIQIEDNGIGMSQEVLSGPLLDFGTQFWGSELMHAQLPGLQSAGFAPTGQYGIGFFSVFMWGNRVSVTSRRFDVARTDTHVLEFSNGPYERPILRVAHSGERMREGGTRVKVWLRDSNLLTNLLKPFYESDLTLAEVCSYWAPSLDVSVYAKDRDADEVQALAANDWQVMDSHDLRKRIAPGRVNPRSRYWYRFSEEPWGGPDLETIETAGGSIVGRAAIWGDPHSGSVMGVNGGVVTVGGLRAVDLCGIEGILIGTSTRASRDEAIPSVGIDLLKEWAHSESDRRKAEGHTESILNCLASTTCGLGLNVEGFPIARCNDGWMTKGAIRNAVRKLNQVLLVDNATAFLAGGKVGELELDEGVFSVDSNAPSFVLSQFHGYLEWPDLPVPDGWKSRRRDAYSLRACVIEAIADGWNCSLEDIFSCARFNDDKHYVSGRLGTVAGKPVSDTVAIVQRPPVAQKRA